VVAFHDAAEQLRNMEPLPFHLSMKQNLFFSAHLTISKYLEGFFYVENNEILFTKNLINLRIICYFE
jgi:hypothetical protein